MARAFYILAAFGLMLSGIVNLLALLGIDLDFYFGYVWLPAVGAFFTFSLAIALKPGRVTIDPRKNGSRSRLDRAFLALSLYAAISFVVLQVQMSGGRPRQQDGRFVLWQNSRLVRPLPAADYHRLQADELRSFSCLWMVFYCFSMLMLRKAIMRNEQKRLRQQTRGNGIHLGEVSEVERPVSRD
jgi:hypothetical protein